MNGGIFDMILYRKIVLFLLLILSCKLSFAESCIPSGMDYVILRSSVIFRGIVVKSNESKAKFKVIDLYKGQIKKYTEVLGDFNTGGEYFILASYGLDGKLYSNWNCGYGSFLFKSLEDWGDQWWNYRGEIESRYIYVAKASAQRDLALIKWNRLLREPEKNAVLTYQGYVENNNFSMALKVYDKYKDTILDGKQENVIKNKSIYVYILASTGDLKKAYDQAKKNWEEFPENKIVQQHYAWILSLLGRQNEIPKNINSFARLGIRNDNFNYSGVKLNQVEFLESSIYKLSFELSQIYSLDFDVSETSLLNFSNSEISSLEYDEVDSDNDKFSGASIDRFDINDSRLDNSDFSNSKVVLDVDDSEFVEVLFENAILDNSEFEEVKFSGVVLKGVSFKASDLSGIYTFDEQGIDFSSVIFDEKTIWPANFDLKTKKLLPVNDENLAEELAKSEEERRMQRYSKRINGYWLLYHQ